VRLAAALVFRCDALWLMLSMDRRLWDSPNRKLIEIKIVGKIALPDDGEVMDGE
jgi:hypothetical protein